jgi:starch synthase (maltosyl-transferring)
MSVSVPRTRRPRIQVEDVWPQLDCGRFAVKRTLGEPVEVWADVFRDGHEVLGAAVRFRRQGERRWREAPMEHHGSDRWTATFTPDTCGRWEFAIGAWFDRFASWRWEIQRKSDAGQEDLSSELAEGALLHGVESLTVEEALASEQADRSEFTSSPTLCVDVDPALARFSSWYELFPRSWGGFKGVEKVLPELAALGFDVVYFPPIHPIGTTNRKGPNNTLVAGPDDPGSPWAIGSELGGHDAINPELGTKADFRRLLARARALGIQICLDFAIQCSPDHPWLEKHPEWFYRRPDGTLKYAENPPKKYQDIYNVNFDSEDWQALWEELRRVLMVWVDLGVTVFRVDNPHTKPVPFWEWLIREVRREHPDVIFLAEAFTRPAMMATLAKAGFNQSYTYFTWRNTKYELQQYLNELARSELKEFFRPNFFANTPDILHEYLQVGGRPAFEARLVLAATLSPCYGLYSGFEHCENVPQRPGSEEYLNSEKYEVKERALDGPLLPLVRRVNEIRRANPALQRIDDIRFLETENDLLLAYAKELHEPANIVVVCVNLDPTAEQHGVCTIPVELGLPPAIEAEELLSETTFSWRIGRNYLRLGPGQSHILRVR